MSSNPIEDEMWDDGEDLAVNSNVIDRAAAAWKMKKAAAEARIAAGTPEKYDLAVVEPTIEGMFEKSAEIKQPEILEAAIQMEAFKLKVKAEGRKRHLSETSHYGLFDGAHLLGAAEIDEDPDVEFLIEGVLEKETLVMLAADSYVGKSYLALDWGLSIAAGVPWHGHETTPTKVLYLMMEGAKTTKKRLHAWKLKRGVELEALGSNFAVYNKVVNFMDDDSVQVLEDHVRDAGIGLIVVDTLSRSIGGANENAQEDMGAFIGAATRIREAAPGSSVLILHHTKKDESRTPRGSTVLFAAMDSVWCMVREDRTTPFRTLENQKMKSSILQPTQHLVFEPVGESAVLEVATLLERDATLQTLSKMHETTAEVTRKDLSEALVNAGIYKTLGSANNRITALLTEGKLEAYGTRNGLVKIPGSHPEL